MRLARSLALSAGVALGAFFLAALALTVLGIYQSGHGNRAWTDVGLVDRDAVHLSLADTLGLAIAACSAVVAFAVSYRKN